MSIQEIIERALEDSEKEWERDNRWRWVMSVCTVVLWFITIALVVVTIAGVTSYVAGGLPFYPPPKLWQVVACCFCSVMNVYFLVDSIRSARGAAKSDRNITRMDYAMRVMRYMRGDFQ